MPAALSARVPAAARHGRGALRRCCSPTIRGPRCRIYAPVGGHRDLLAYLVRRLLENGANSSFVSVAADPEVPVAIIAASGREPDRRRRGTRATRTSRCRATSTLRNGAILPASNSATGASLAALLAEIRRAGCRPRRRRLSTAVTSGSERPVLSPIDDEPIGSVSEGDDAVAAAAMAAAHAGFAAWAADAGRNARNRARTRRRSAGGEARPADGAAAGRRRQDARRCAGGGARGGRFLPLLRGAGAADADPAADAGSDRRNRTCCATAGVACSSASARGIFRWRSSSGR